MDQTQFDAIVVGAGLGGLTAGCYLAAQGQKVLILEKHDRVGGFATSFKRRGFVFDVSLHNMGPLYENNAFCGILKDINVLDKLEFIKFDEYQRILYPDHEITISKGIDNYAALLKDLFPQESTGIEELLRVFTGVYDEFTEIEDLGASFAELEKEYPFLPIKFPYLVRLADKTLADVMEPLISDDRLRSMVGNLWWICGLPPSKVAAILYCIPTIQYCGLGGGIVKGTSQRLSNVMLESLFSRGGNALLKTEIKRIVVRNGRVTGVESKDGQTFKAETVIANVNPQDVFLKMIDAKEIAPEYHQRISKQKLSTSATQLFLGVDLEPKRLGMKGHSTVIFEDYDHEKCYANVLSGNHEGTFCLITNHSSVDESVAPKGCSVVNLMTLDNIQNWEGLTPEEYRSKKKDVAEKLIARAQKVMPELAEHVVVWELGTPLTVRRYTSNPQGAIYGFAQSNDQSGLNRFTAETPIEGLFLCGAYTYPGAGYSSVITSGYKAAHLALNKK